MSRGQFEPRRIGTAFYSAEVRDEGGTWYTVDFKTRAARSHYLAYEGTHSYVKQLYEVPRYADDGQ